MSPASDSSLPNSDRECFLNSEVSGSIISCGVYDDVNTSALV